MHPAARAALGKEIAVTEMNSFWRGASATVLVAALAACGGDAGDGGEAKGTAAAPAKAGDTAAAAAAAKPAGPPPQFKFGNTAAQAQACLEQRQQRMTAAANALKADSTAKAPGAGKHPGFAVEQKWYPRMPAFRDGAILPCNRVVVYYGNPASKKMGALGEYPRDEMLSRLTRQVNQWKEADPNTPVVPGLHLIAVVAQGDPGPSGKYRTQIRDAVVDSIHKMAQSINGVLFVDVQVGTDDIRNIMPRFDTILQKPDIHFAVDPEFYMRDGVQPGRKIGTMYAADINWVMDRLTKIVQDNNLPPKMLIIHRFTRGMVPDVENVRLRPEVQLVMHMDGWGAPWLKYDSYRDYVVR
ncbi:MAG TPA: hypothetical protein VF625_14680, partial [Longimicrobium sp.]